MSQSIQNPGFEATKPTDQLRPDAWTIKETAGFSAQLDRTHTLSGAQALKIASTVDAPSGFQSFSQACPVQLTRPTVVHLRTSIKSGNPAGVALWCQIWDDKKMIGFVNSQSRGIEPTGTGDWRELDLTLLVKPNAKRFVFGGYMQGKGEAWFDEVRFETAAGTNDTPPSPVVKAYLDEAIVIVQQNALVRDSVQWPQTKAEMLGFASGMQTEREAHLVVEHLINVLTQYGDKHSSFSGPKRAAAYRAAQPTEQAPKPVANYLEQGIAYVAVPSFGSVNEQRTLDFATEIQSLIRAIDTKHAVSGWIVDLRNNGGGNMYPMIAGLGPLLGEGTLGYFVKAKDEVAWAYNKGEAYAGKPGGGTKVAAPYHLRSKNAPVAVLIGSRTASSGEMTAISFVGRPATRFFGQPTAGFTTANRSFDLSDGAKINLAVSVTADRNHQKYPQRLTPDQEIEKQPQEATDLTIEAAKAWLVKR
ncbi:S41 family peptidase [Hymenobacter sp. YC55]|nr:S41 family peptidase [Hymenobacter sp. YC55]